MHFSEIQVLPPYSRLLGLNDGDMCEAVSHLVRDLAGVELLLLSLQHWFLTLRVLQSDKIW